MINNIDSLISTVDTSFIYVVDTVYVNNANSPLYEISFWIPLVIALFALFVSLDSAKSNRKQNRLSARPLLRIDGRFTNSKRITFTLINAGLGPAEINSYKLFWDNKEIDELTMEHIESHNLKLFLNLGDAPKVEFSPALFKVGEFIPPQSREKLLIFNLKDYLESINEKNPLNEIYKHIMKHFKIVIRYQSTFEEDQKPAEFPKL